MVILKIIQLTANLIVGVKVRVASVHMFCIECLLLVAFRQGKVSAQEKPKYEDDQESKDKIELLIPCFMHFYLFL